MPGRGELVRLPVEDADIAEHGDCFRCVARLRLDCKADGGGEVGLSENYGSFHIIRFIVSYLISSMSGSFQAFSSVALLGTPSLKSSVPGRVSTLSGVTIDGGIC